MNEEIFVAKTRVVYTPFITLKNGRRLIASNYGKKVFRFEVEEKDEPENQDNQDQD